MGSLSYFKSYLLIPAVEASLNEETWKKLD